MFCLLHDTSLWGFLPRQRPVTGDRWQQSRAQAISASRCRSDSRLLRSVIYDTFIVHGLIRCKTSCQSTCPCSFTAVMPAARRCWQVTLTDGGTGINAARADSHRHATHPSKVPEQGAFPALLCSGMYRRDPAWPSCWRSHQLLKEFAAVLIFPALVYPSNHKIRQSCFICVWQPSVFFSIIRKTTDCKQNVHAKLLCSLQNSRRRSTTIGSFNQGPFCKEQIKDNLQLIPQVWCHYKVAGEIYSSHRFYSRGTTTENGLTTAK